MIVAMSCAWYLNNARWSALLDKSVNEGIVAWHLFNGLAHEIEAAKQQGRPSEIVGLPDMEGLRQQVQQDIELEKAAKGLITIQPQPAAVELDQ
jgi:hypothetical protein